MSLDRVIKLICIICLNLTVGALIVARNSPAVVYEPSIYTATPQVVWLVLFINLICGIGIIVHQVASNRHTKDNLWFLGILLILINYAIMLSLWIIRGYAQWNIGDPAVHLGLIQNIISYGYINAVRENSYPIIHIYISQISFLSGISHITLSKYIPFIFALLYVAFMYLLIESVLPDKGQVILALTASMTLMPTTYLDLTPNMESNFVFPLAVFLFIKSANSSTVQWKILFIVMIFLFPVFHSISSLAFFVTMIIIWFENRFFSAMQLRSNKAIFTDFKFTFTASLLFLIVYISGFSGTAQWPNVITSIKMSVMGDTVGWANDYIETAKYAESVGYSVTQYFFRIYGGNLIYIILALLSILVLIKKFQTNLLSLIYLYGPIATLGLGVIAFFLLRVSFGPQRLIVHIIILCTPFVGFLLYEFLKRMCHSQAVYFLKIMAICSVLFLLVVVSVNGAARLYSSPYIYLDNGQITRTEMAGMDNFIHNKNTSMNITGMKVMPGQFSLLLLTPKELVGRQDVITPRGMIREELQPPWHFGYDNYSSLGYWLSQDTYMVLTDRDKSVYKDIYPSMAELRFVPQDFERLNYDSSIDYVYSNGNLNVYFIHSTLHRRIQ
jgi:hypothetical protein